MGSTLDYKQVSDYFSTATGKVTKASIILRLKATLIIILIYKFSANPPAGKYRYVLFIMQQSIILPDTGLSWVKRVSGCSSRTQVKFIDHLMLNHGLLSFRQRISVSAQTT